MSLDVPSGSPPAGSRYEQALRERHQTLRAAVLDVAGEILAAAGIAGLTMRRLASALGCTTTVLYTMFASKQRPVDAIYRDGFEPLTALLQPIPRHAPPDHRLR